MKKFAFLFLFGCSIAGASFISGPSGGGGTGILTLNTLTADPQSFATGTSGSDFAINSSGDTHTFNLPNASATARGIVSTGAQTFAGAKTFEDGVVGDVTGSLTGNVTGNVTGNADTATALAANPDDCGGGEFASAIAASGNLTCSNPFTGLVESYSGHIETVSDKTYVIDEYASFAKQVTNIRIKCGSGSVTAALQIGGSNITTCNGISVTTTAGTTTCDTGASNDLAANGRLTLVTTSNSSCTDLSFTIKTARD